MIDEKLIQPNTVYASCVASHLAKEGISLTRYAARLGVSLRTVERWISGEITCPQPRQLIMICRIHGMDFDHPEDLGFAPRTTHPKPNARRRPLGPGSEDEDVVSMLRRDLLGMTAAVVYSTTLARPIARLLDAGPAAKAVSVGRADIRRVEEADRRVQQIGDMAGGNALGRRTLVHEYHSAVAMLHGRFSSTADRQRAHLTASRLAKNVGWNLYDLGMHDEARKTWLAALAIARDAEPSTVAILTAWTLENMGHQAIALGRPRDALHMMAMASGAERELPSLLRANLSGVRAQATAALGDVEETRRHIGWAQDHIDDAADARDWVWNDSGWYNEAEMNGTAGHALATLAVSRGGAMCDDALDRASASLGGFRDDDSRARARVHNTLFRLHATTRDAAATEAAGRTAVEAARLLRSPRVVGELIAIRPRLSPLRRHPGIAEIDREITQLAKDTSA